MHKPIRPDLFEAALAAQSLLHAKPVHKLLRKARKKVDKTLRRQLIATCKAENLQDLRDGYGVAHIQEQHAATAAEASLMAIGSRDIREHHAALRLLTTLALSDSPFDHMGLRVAVTPDDKHVLRQLSRSSVPEEAEGARTILKAVETKPLLGGTQRPAGKPMQLAS